MSEPKLPDLIRVEREGATFRILVDGELFPFFTSSEPALSHDVQLGAMPQITVSIPAGRVEIVNEV